VFSKKQAETFYFLFKKAAYKLTVCACKGSPDLILEVLQKYSSHDPVPFRKATEERKEEATIAFLAA
jgi:hypothetical protein